MGEWKDSLLRHLWVYELPGDSISEHDLSVAREDYNLHTEEHYSEPMETYIVGSWYSILGYLKEYIGVEPNMEYMTPLRNVFVDLEGNRK